MKNDRPLLSLKRKTVTPETGDTPLVMPARHTVIPAASASQVYQQKRAAREAQDRKQSAVVSEASVSPVPAPASSGRPHGRSPRLMPVEQTAGAMSKIFHKIERGPYPVCSQAANE